MLHNNIGLCLIKQYENAEPEPPAEPADEKKEAVFSFQKNKRANTEKDKAMV